MAATSPMATVGRCSLVLLVALPLGAGTAWLSYTTHTDDLAWLLVAYGLAAALWIAHEGGSRVWRFVIAAVVGIAATALAFFGGLLELASLGAFD